MTDSFIYFSSFTPYLLMIKQTNRIRRNLMVLFFFYLPFYLILTVLLQHRALVFYSSLSIIYLSIYLLARSSPSLEIGVQLEVEGMYWFDSFCAIHLLSNLSVFSPSCSAAHIYESNTCLLACLLGFSYKIPFLVEGLMGVRLLWWYYRHHIFYIGGYLLSFIFLV